MKHAFSMTLALAACMSLGACVSQPAEQYAVTDPVTAALQAVDFAKHIKERALVVDTIIYVTPLPFSDPSQAVRHESLPPSDVPARVGAVHLIPGADRVIARGSDTGVVQIVRDTMVVTVPNTVRVTIDVVTGSDTGFLAVVLLTRSRRGWAIHSVSYIEE